MKKIPYAVVGFVLLGLTVVGYSINGKKPATQTITPITEDETNNKENSVIVMAPDEIDHTTAATH